MIGIKLPHMAESEFADIKPHIIHEFAIQCAERSLGRLRGVGLAIDNRAVNAIAVKRAWLGGEVSDLDLRAAGHAAHNAGMESPWDSLEVTVEQAETPIWRYRAAISHAYWTCYTASHKCATALMATAAAQYETNVAYEVEYDKHRDEIRNAYAKMLSRGQRNRDIWEWQQIGKDAVLLAIEAMAICANEQRDLLREMAVKGEADA